MQIVVIQVPSGLHTDDVRLDCTCAYDNVVVPKNAIVITNIEKAIMSNEISCCTIL
jgi:hypothetical protein